MSDFVTVANVHIGSIGIDWPTASGPRTIILEHLVDMMVAANEDPLVSAARLKLGHEAWQLHPDGGVVELGDYDVSWSGEPCFGTAENFRLSDDGGDLYCDFRRVPEWLAIWMPTAWPTRSFELEHDVVTEGGQKYTRVVTAVALLGVRQQALKNLSDVRRALDGDPEIVEFNDL